MKQLELNYKAYQKNSATSKSAWKNKKNKITLMDDTEYRQFDDWLEGRV